MLSIDCELFIASVVAATESDTPGNILDVISKIIRSHCELVLIFLFVITLF